jgi:uncharacterized protein YcgI (DUF1989 family)
MPGIAGSSVTLTLNHQHLDLLDRSVRSGEATDRVELVKLALRESAAGVVPRRQIPGVDPHRVWDTPPVASAHRRVVEDFELEPGTGRAIELAAGQILRIEQIRDPQCVDFNCFNMADYREFMHTGRTRTLHGIHPSVGDFLWSAPPRERAMMYILTDTAGCNDVLFPRCSAVLYESTFGFGVHTNCADIQAESIREYGLTPDDVHDSFNMFMATSIQGTMPTIDRPTSKPGDHIELLALMDVLAVPNACGSDVHKTSNYSISPVRVVVMEAATHDLEALPPRRRYHTQRTPADFECTPIRVDRTLRRDPGYVPRFAHVPLDFEQLQVALTADERDMFDRIAARESLPDDGAALRDIVLTWWASSHA